MRIPDSEKIPIRLAMVEWDNRGMPSRLKWDSSDPKRLKDVARWVEAFAHSAYISQDGKSWVQMKNDGSMLHMLRSLTCFRTTPGATLSTAIGSQTENLANAVNEQMYDNEFSFGCGGIICVLRKFDRRVYDATSGRLKSRKDDPVLPYSKAVEQGIWLPKQTKWSIRELSSTPMSTLCPGLVPKTPKALKKFKNNWSGLMKISHEPTVLDALYFTPRRWLDLTKKSSVEDIRVGIETCVVGELESTFEGTTRTNLKYFGVRVRDHNGVTLDTAVYGWDEVMSAKERLRGVPKGGEVMIWGRGKLNKSGRNTLSSPYAAPLDDMSMMPVYSSSKKFSINAQQARKIISTIVDIVCTDGIEEVLPDSLIKSHDLMGRTEAFRNVHFPTSWGSAIKGRNRLVYDEFARLQVDVEQRKNSVCSGVVVANADSHGFVSGLPFAPTDDQMKAIDAVASGLSSGQQMRTLISGDVGCGKTLVAQAGAYMAAAGGFQTAILAPTTVLAEQLYLGVKKFLPGIKSCLMTGGVETKAMKKKADNLASGETMIAVGTHSLLSDRVRWKNLGLVIVDEQQRFGKQQREKLSLMPSIGSSVPNYLMMTATPIPSTLASTLYGDLDVVTIREKPAGRKPISTYHIDEAPSDSVVSMSSEPWRELWETVSRGEKAYVVCSLVEETLEEDEKTAVKEAYRQISEAYGNAAHVVYGKMKATEKKAALEGFHAPGGQVIVGSQVVEVGIDEPDATLMIILNPERLGLSSMHQIRGRVGRSEKQSKCYLVGNPEADSDAYFRIKAMCETNDGFVLAKEDLELRGEGEYWGDRRSGENDLGMANLVRDRKILEDAHEDMSVMSQQIKAVLAEESRHLHSLD